MNFCNSFSILPFSHCWCCHAKMGVLYPVVVVVVVEWEASGMKGDLNPLPLRKPSSPVGVFRPGLVILLVQSQKWP